MVCADELVPVDDRLRRIDAVADWGFARAEHEGDALVPLLERA